MEKKKEEISVAFSSQMRGFLARIQIPDSPHSFFSSFFVFLVVYSQAAFTKSRIIHKQDVNYFEPIFWEQRVANHISFFESSHPQ